MQGTQRTSTRWFFGVGLVGEDQGLIEWVIHRRLVAFPCLAGRPFARLVALALALALALTFAHALALALALAWGDVPTSIAYVQKTTRPPVGTICDWNTDQTRTPQNPKTAARS